jgi:hypothetical protein
MRTRSAAGAASRITYVWPEDVVGYRRLVDGRVFVGLEVDEGVVRDALGGGFSCSRALWLAWILTGCPFPGTAVARRSSSSGNVGRGLCALLLREPIVGSRSSAAIKGGRGLWICCFAMCDRPEVSQCWIGVLRDSGDSRIGRSGQFWAGAGEMSGARRENENVE